MILILVVVDNGLVLDKFNRVSSSMFSFLIMF